MIAGNRNLIPCLFVASAFILGACGGGGNGGSGVSLTANEDQLQPESGNEVDNSQFQPDSGSQGDNGQREPDIGNDMEDAPRPGFSPPFIAFSETAPTDQSDSDGDSAVPIPDSGSDPDNQVQENQGFLNFEDLGFATIYKLKSSSEVDNPDSEEDKPKVREAGNDEIVETTFNSSTSTYPGFIKLTGRVTINPADDDSDTETVNVEYYGFSVNNDKNDPQVVLIMDQNGGVAVGGVNLEGVPSGDQEYKGVNTLIYTQSAKRYDLQTGPFLLKVNFTTGVGKLDSLTRSEFPPGQDDVVAGARLRGNLEVDAENGQFIGNELKLTAQTVDGNTYAPVAIEPEHSAKIYGEFHGRNGVDVTGIYVHSDSNRQFYGGILGSSDSSISVDKVGLSTDFE